MASLLDAGSFALSLLSTGVKFYSAYKGGDDQGDYYEAQAGAAFIDARRALADARQVRDVAELEATQVRRSGAEYRSAARAAYGANGIDVNFGSALDVQTDITARANRDAFNAILLGERQARGLEEQAAGLVQQGQQFQTAGGNARSGGALAAAGQALAGGADLWSKWRATEP